MNKKLLAVAIAAGLAAPMFAQAGDVKVYGRIQAEYNNEGRDSGDIGQGVDDEAGMSRLGFKATEDLGNGLTGFAKAEFRIDPADNDHNGTNGAAPYSSLSNAPIGQRDVHVGIKSKQWGSIAAGSFAGIYKNHGGVKYDPFVATHLQARRAGGMTGGAGFGGHNGFIRNAIQYQSPKINGFQASLQIAPDETNSAADNSTGADNDWALGVKYNNGPLEVVFAHSRNNGDGSNTANQDQKMTKIGGKYKFGNHQFAGQYEWWSDPQSGSGSSGINQGTAPGGGTYNRGTAGGDGNTWFLGYQFKQGNNIWVAQLGQHDDDTTGSGLDSDYYALGIIHKFSKTTRIFGGYTATDNDTTSADRDAWTIGIRKDF